METFTVQNLEQLLHEFNTQTDNEVRSKIEGILNTWRNSDQSFPQSLEIIKTSLNEPLIMFAIFTLEFLLGKKFSLLSQDHVKALVETILGRVRPQSPQLNLSATASNNILHLLALTIHTFPSLFDFILSGNFLTATEAIALFDFIFVISEELYNKAFSSDESIRYPITEEQLALHSRLNQTAENFFSLLLQFDPTQITPHWVFLLRRIISIMPNISSFNVFIPYLQVAIQNPNLIPSLLDLYQGEGHAVLSLAETLTEEEDYAFFKVLIETFLAFTDQVMTDQDPMMLGYVSFIWQATIDLNFDFYGSEFVGIEFASAVFTKFINQMIVILQNDRDNFFILLEIYASCISYQSNEFTMEFKVPFITQALDFFIFFIDNSPINEICGYQLDNITKQLMENTCLDVLSDDAECKQNKQDYIQLLSRYIDAKYKGKQLTNGVIYVFSFAPQEVLKLFANGIMTELLTMENPPITSVYWIEQSVNYTPDSIDRQITFVYSLIPYAPSIEIGEVFSVLTLHYPSKFLEQADTFISPLFELIQGTPMNNVSALLLSSVFNILWFIANQASSQEESVGQSLLAQYKPLFDQAGALFTMKIGDSIPDLGYMNRLGDFLKIIMEKSSHDDKSLSAFYASLFDAIFALYAPFFKDTDEQIQGNICSLVEESLKFNWIINKQPIFEWIIQIIQVMASSAHLEILGMLPEFLPSEIVNQYLKVGLENKDIFMVPSIIDFFTQVLEAYPESLFEKIPFEIVMMPFQNEATPMFERYLNFCLSLIQLAPLTPELLQPICKLLAFRAFAQKQFTTDAAIALTVVILKQASDKYNVAENVLQLIAQAASLSEEQAAQFAQAFMQGIDTPAFQQGIVELTKFLLA